ncbi:MAG TPA: hypothetical protein VFZ97_12385 [Acidimicrobiales bacterium]
MQAPTEPSAIAKGSDLRVVPFIPAAVLTLVTGGIMMTAGYIFATDGWALAGPIMIPSGPLISVAFALARRPRRPARSSDMKVRVRHIASIALGLPSPGGDVTLTVTLLITIVTLLAGAVMVVAGYATAAWNLAIAPPLIVASGLIITGAFVIADRADRSGNRDQDRSERIKEE